MAEPPLVSVIIPTYNNAALAPEAVASALAQTYRPLEVVAVDDGSTDDTPARLARFGDKIALIRQEHKGPAVARNTGLKASSGQFVAFLDSDDTWMPRKLALCVHALQQNPEAGVAYTALNIHELETGLRYRQKQYTHSGWMARELFMECRGVNTSTLVVRRTCLDEAGLFDEEFFRAQDWDLMLRLAERFPYAHVAEVLTERRLHSRSLSVTHAHLYAKYNLLVLEKALARRPDLYADIQATAHALAYLRFGLSHYAEFRLARARKEFRRSLAYEWTRRAFSYWLRTYLPVFTLRILRTLRMAVLQLGRRTRAKEPPHE